MYTWPGHRWRGSYTFGPKHWGPTRTVLGPRGRFRHLGRLKSTEREDVYFEDRPQGGSDVGDAGYRGTGAGVGRTTVGVACGALWEWIDHRYGTHLGSNSPEMVRGWHSPTSHTRMVSARQDVPSVAPKALVFPGCREATCWGS